jgi:hypothetical protein
MVVPECWGPRDCCPLGSVGLAQAGLVLHPVADDSRWERQMIVAHGKWYTPHRCSPHLRWRSMWWSA